MLEYLLKPLLKEGCVIRSLSGLLVMCGLALVVSGCATLDQIALRRTRADRQRIFEFYGDCLIQNYGEQITIAKFCNSVAEIRHAREKDASLNRCPLSEYFPCIQP